MDMGSQKKPQMLKCKRKKRSSRPLDNPLGWDLRDVFQLDSRHRKDIFHRHDSLQLKGVDLKTNWNKNKKVQKSWSTLWPSWAFFLLRCSHLAETTMGARTATTRMVRNRTLPSGEFPLS